MKVGWWAMSLLAGWGLTGCYRSAEVPLQHVRSMQSDGDDSLVLELEGGGTQRFPEYDELVVEVEPPGADATELELKTPLRASLDAKRLRLATPERGYDLARPDVHAITLEQHAPSRPYIIAGAALGAMLLGGIVGASSTSCHEGEDFCGLGRAYMAGVGSLVGLGLGLAISIPLTSTLSSERSGPAADEPWRPRVH